ncbi:hypothetical protein [Microbulbifer sp. JTAC008]|uniref:hypothetical protein n=1 Tax=Microbulbifer sp. JTAC008 TaxID=3243374 RepID=UPI00403A5DDB
MMHLKDCEKIIDADGPFRWVYPGSIEGFNSAALKSENERKWFRKGNFSEDVDSADEVITDYLYECLLERKNLIDNEESITVALDVDAVMLVKAGICLICNFGSSYAGTHLSDWRELLTTNNASTCLDLLESAYEDSDSFIRDILRDFILELFRYGPLWDPQEGYFSKALSDKENKFLSLVLKQGYLTISNQDARLFVDGSRRI